MRQFFLSLACAALGLTLGSCTSVPSFQDVAVGNKGDGGASITPADVVTAIRCELHDAANDPVDGKALSQYVVAAALTLRVDDNAGVLPSLSFIDPGKTSGTNFTFGLNGQLSGTRQRIFTETVQYDVDEIAKGPACQKAKSGFQVNGINLLGDLGLLEIAHMGLSTANQSGGVAFPDPAKPTEAPSYAYPAFGSTVQFTLTKTLGIGPTWTLTRFKGPTGTSGSSGGTSVGGAPGLLSGARTDTHLLLITFGPPKKGPHGITVSTEESKQAAGATAQSMILDLRLQLLQGAIQ